MRSRLIEIDMDLVHDTFEYGRPRFSLCLFNDSYEIPRDWYSEDEQMELKLNFTIDLMVRCFIENFLDFRKYNEDDDHEPLIDEIGREDVETFKKELQRAIDKLNRIKYITTQEINDMQPVEINLKEEYRENT
jgi:hypothetical protein